MKAYLIQHGKPVSKEENPDKPLSEEGKKDVTKMALLLRSCAPLPETIFHSGKTRAEQTAAIMASRLGPGVKIGKRGGLSPLDDVREIGEALAQENRDTIIVGHLPHLARLASFLLVGDETHNLVRFQQGGILCLERAEGGDWSIGWMAVPEMVQPIPAVSPQPSA